MDSEQGQGRCTINTSAFLSPSVMVWAIRHTSADIEAITKKARQKSKAGRSVVTKAGKGDLGGGVVESGGRSPCLQVVLLCSPCFRQATGVYLAI